jgi:hypothetical protein
MSHLITLSAMFIPILAYGGSISAAQATSEPIAVGQSKNPRWEIAIEGLPVLSGRTITAATMGGNGRYSLGRSGFTSSVSILQDEPSSDMMFNFNEENTRCFNKGNARVTIDGDKAVLSGEVECMPISGDKQRQSAAIQGWFELKK